MNAETVTPEVMPDATAELAVITQKYELAPKTAADLRAEFAPLFKEASELVRESHDIVVTDASQKLKIQQAGLCRKALKANRLAAEKLKDSLKRDSLRYSNAVQGLYNYHLLVVSAEEERLEKQEKFVAIKEAERKAALSASRQQALAPFGLDTSFMQLGEMPDETFAQLLENTRAGHEAKLAAERKAQEDRIRAENERLKEEARIREENLRLQKEAKEREEAAKAEREAAAAREKAQQEAAEATLRAERERLEAIAQAERQKAAKAAEEAAAKAKAERDAAIEANRKERLRIQAQAEVERQRTEAARAAAESEAHRQRVLREQIEAELSAKAAAEAEAARQAELAPDKQKLLGVAKALRTLDVPKVASEAAQDVVAELLPRLTKLAAWLEVESSRL